MNLKLIRILFIGTSAVIGLGLAHLHFAAPDATVAELVALDIRSLVIGGLAGLGAVAFEIILARRMASLIPSILLGLVLGVVTGGLADRLLTFFAWYEKSAFASIGPFVLSWLFIYLWCVVIIQTRDTFKVSIPYVDFKRQGRGLRPLVADTSVLIDGRLTDLASTHLVDVPVVVPRMVLHELQELVDSDDRSGQLQGRRGLEKLQELRDRIDVRFDESALTGDRERHLVEMTRRHDGILVTVDANLAQMSTLEDVDALNLNEVAEALVSVHLPGDELEVEITKPGEGARQGVAWMEDGTMVVVENGRDRIGSRVRVVVSRTLQTGNGRLVFARVLD